MLPSSRHKRSAEPTKSLVNPTQLPRLRRLQRGAQIASGTWPKRLAQKDSRRSHSAWSTYFSPAQRITTGVGIPVARWHPCSFFGEEGKRVPKKSSSRK